MKTYLDSTVLVSLLYAQSRFKAAADAALAEASGQAFTSTHALVEIYRTLTSLRWPIPPRAAQQLVTGIAAENSRQGDLPVCLLSGAVGGGPAGPRRADRL
jgi:PIN domain-containing protein